MLEIDHSAFAMGWRIGKALNSMRWRKPPDPDVPVVPEYDVVFEKGVLYIKKAPAVMVGSTLSFASADINGGGSIG
jgi:hypothetical protein